MPLKSASRTAWLLMAAAVIVLLLSIFIGRYPQPGLMDPFLLSTDTLAQRLVLNLRLPRIIAALLLGASLGAAGSTLQTLFRNPLVEPGFLGVTQGAAFGAALCILWLGTNPLVIELVAAAFAMLGLLLSAFIAHRLRYGGWVLRLLLAGIAVSALFSAGVGVLKYLADPLKELPEIVFWLLGGLYSVTWRDVLYLLPVVIPALAVLLLLRWRLNLLALGDETAASLGVSVRRERAVMLTAAVAATAAVIAVAGVVGWVGLIVPQVARRWAGADTARSLPLSMGLGALFTLICDDLARTLLPGELPLGILTSLIGALLFILFLMTRTVKVAR